jgi:hypothetical protein
MKELTEEETMEAADRFLQPALVAERRKYFEISMQDYKNFPTEVRSERDLKGVTTEVSTVEQWKELLPDSYQAVVADRKASLKIDFGVDLQSGISFSFSPAMYRNIEEYKVWLKALKLGPETVFETVCHGAVAMSKVMGYLPDTIDGFAVTWPLAFRAGTASTSVILPLDITASSELTKQPLGFYLVQFSAKIF